MPDTDSLARGLAVVFTTGEWSAAALVGRARQALGITRGGQWLAGLAQRVVARFGADPPPPRQSLLARFIAEDAAFRRAAVRYNWGIDAPAVNTLVLPRPVMTPAPALSGVQGLPELVTSRAVSDWLGLPPGQLDWLADIHGRERRTSPGPLRNYRYRWIGKPGGGRRLLEAPKRRLKAVQRRILHEILDRIPPHDAAHAFRPGRSVATLVAPHVGRHIVVRVDLRHFFPSIRHARVHALFRTIGYPEAVATLLAGLCTNAAPDDVFAGQDDWLSLARREELRRIHRTPHLPQGAPTSPALANLCAWRLDCRLAALARTAGGEYTRYADDLIFSGGRELRRSVPRFLVLVAAIALDEHFAIRRRKTRVMPHGGRQQVAGVVVNARTNLARREFDRLKAMLHNCIHTGPTVQNRDQRDHFREHLRGRIAWVTQLNPSRGRRLQALFERIAWNDAEMQ